MCRLFTWMAALAVLVALSGCRTYGGYGSESATYDHIVRAVERSEQDLSRVRGDLSSIEAASSEDPVLSALAVQYAQLAAAHEAVLDEHRDLAADVSPESDYRTLRRVYGAIISEQRLIRLQYQGLLRYVYDAFAPDTAAVEAHDRPYYVVPPYYERANYSERQLTLNDVMSRLAEGARPRAGFRLMVLEPASDEAAAHEEGGGASGGH